MTLFAPASGKSHALYYPETTSLADLKAWLLAMPSSDGSPTAICSLTGAPYVEVYASHLFRRGDGHLADRAVARAMYAQIVKLLRQAGRPYIFWRVRLETEIMLDPQVAEYRDDGPDKEFATDKRCVLDRKWFSAKAYCRLCVGEDNAPSLRK